MRIIRYDKLVRDRIPEIIRASGKSCTTEVLSDEAYLRMIDAKLDEELAEYHQEQNLEELADLLEVLRAAVIARGYTLDELESIRAQKAAKRGGFAQKILLKEVVENERWRMSHAYGQGVHPFLHRVSRLCRRTVGFSNEKPSRFATAVFP